MTKRIHVGLLIAALMPVLSNALLAQASRHTPDAASGSSWTHPKTPWGDPDIQGIWPSANIAVSPVASNCNTADPNWNPCVHSVQPRDVYLPAAVNTGVPADGVQVFSIAAILRAERSNRRATAGNSAFGVSFESMRIMCVTVVTGVAGLKRGPGPTGGGCESRRPGG